MGLYQDFKKTFDFVILVLAFGFVSFLFPFIALFGFRGIEKSFNRELVVFYWIAGAIGILLLGINEFVQYFSKKNQKIYNMAGWLGSIIINPEISLLYNSKTGDYYKFFKWFKKTSHLLWMGIILFSVFGIFATYTNTFLTELPNIVLQQVYPLGEAILAVEPAGVEIFPLFWLVSMNLYLWKYMQKKAEFDNSIYWVIAIPTSLIIGVLYGVVLHFFAYSSSDRSLFAVGIFWFTCTLLILIFANIFIVWLFKDINNLFVWFNEKKFADEKIAIMVGIFIAFVFLIGMFVWLIKKAKNKKFALGLGFGESGKA